MITYVYSQINELKEAVPMLRPEIGEMLDYSLLVTDYFPDLECRECRYVPLKGVGLVQLGDQLSELSQKEIAAIACPAFLFYPLDPNVGKEEAIEQLDFLYPDFSNPNTVVMRIGEESRVRTRKDILRETVIKRALGNESARIADLCKIIEILLLMMKDGTPTSMKNEIREAINLINFEDTVVGLNYRNNPDEFVTKFLARERIARRIMEREFGG